MIVCMKDGAWEFVQMEWCSVVEYVKRNTMRCFGHMERKKRVKSM